MTGSLLTRARGQRPSVTDWSCGMSVGCDRGSNCLLVRAMDGRRIMRGGAVISSYQSVATSEIVYFTFYSDSEDIQYLAENLIGSLLQLQCVDEFLGTCRRPNCGQC